MKGKKRLCKKALSLFLTVVMLMTCWVFFAPTKADAATAGSYYVKVNYKVTNDAGEYDNTYTGKSSFDTSKDTNNRAGFSIFYKTNNGTGSEYEVYWDIGKKAGSKGQASGSGASVSSATGNMTSTGTYVATATIPGFPSYLFACNDDDTWGNSVYEITSIQVGSSSSNLTTIWSGTGYLNSSTKQKYISIYPTSESGNDSSYAYVNTDTPRKWNSPTQTTITGLSATTLTINKTSGSVTSSALTGVVKDQYGVNWYQAPTYTLTNASGTAVSNPSKATSGDGVKLTATTACLTTANGYTTASGTAAFTLKATSGTATQSVTITVKSPTYYVYFYDGDGNQITYKSCYYNGSVTAPTSATKSPDATYHYQ
ncbi:MAG: hypothetical protein ACI4XE_06265, partial [Acutalibacteraceae bacterium]